MCADFLNVLSERFMDFEAKGFPKTWKFFCEGILRKGNFT